MNIVAASEVVTALTTAMSGIATDVQAGIAGVLPVALGILGTILVVKIGIRVFKSVTH